MKNASVSPLPDAPQLRPARWSQPRPRPAVPEAWPVAIFGVPFDSMTVDGAIARIDTMIESRRPHYVVTANVDFLVQAHRDVELRRILVQADLVLCDGTPLVWASRWLGNALPERVAGSDLAPSLLENAARKGHRVFLLGAAPGIAAEATARLRRQFPLLNVVGHYAPPFSALLEMDHAEIARRVRAARPDVLLVSFGCPKQEKWIAMHYRNLGVPVSIGVGATIDFLAGRVKRAPDWMRRSGTEWIYRLMQEPRRLYRRYAKDLAVFLPTLARHWWHFAGPGPVSAEMHGTVTTAAGWSHVEAGRELTRGALEHDGDFWRDLMRQPGHCLLDVSAVRRIDATGIAFLVRWRRTLLARRRQLVLLSPSASLRRTLETLRLADYFLLAGDAAEALRQVAAATSEPPVLRGSAARTLAWCGEIIAANVEDVWQMTTDHVRTFAGTGATLIVIDLSRLRFIDSSGAGLMLRVKKWAQQFPAEVLYTKPEPNIRNVLQLTRLDQVLLEGGQ